MIYFTRVKQAMRRTLHRKKWLNKDTDALFRAILLLRTQDEARRFFRDLLSENEIIEFAARWRVAQMLDRKVLYQKIARETGLSSRTIARIQKWLERGKGGYKLVLKRQKHKS